MKSQQAKNGKRMQVNIEISTELYRRLKLESVIMDTPMRDLFESALKHFVGDIADQKKKIISKLNSSFNSPHMPCAA